ncbi:MAG TPA: hypothetical protein VJZ71_05670 [Phycisphaerae bacterium]|nr:hypothetical protein [Phycisphaerae bacterium]
MANWIALRLAELTYLRGIEESVSNPIRALWFLAAYNGEQQADQGLKKAATLDGAFRGTDASTD